jgi:hypothetical protein
LEFTPKLGVDFPPQAMGTLSAIPWGHYKYIIDFLTMTAEYKEMPNLQKVLDLVKKRIEHHNNFVETQKNILSIFSD